MLGSDMHFQTMSLGSKEAQLNEISEYIKMFKKDYSDWYYKKAEKEVMNFH